MELAHTYKYLGVQLDDKQDRKGQSRLLLLKRLAPFNICKKLFQVFYKSVVASALTYIHISCMQQSAGGGGQPQEEAGQSREEGRLCH